MPSTKRGRGKARRSATPAQELAVFIGRFEPAIGALLKGARAVLHRRLPTANQLVYDNYNALAIGFSSTDRVSDVIISLAAYARGVNLYFMYGARLPDPRHLLKGAGSQGRFTPLESVAALGHPAVLALIAAAVRQARTPLRRDGRGRLVIKSVSKKQRPRRPVAAA